MVVTNAVNGSPALVFTTLLVICLATCVLRAQSCMPMMPMMSVSSMVQQTANGFLYQASTQFFTPFMTYVGEPLMKLIFFGPTSLVSHVLFEMTPIPFSSYNITREVLRVIGVLLNWVNIFILPVEAAIRASIDLARVNVWTFLTSKLRLVYDTRILLADNLTASYALSQTNVMGYEAVDDQVALRVRDMSNRQDEGRSYEGAAQDCVRELLCGLYASRATTHLWQTFWTMVPSDEDRAEEPPNLPQLCEKQEEEFTSCYAFADDVVQTWQSLIEYSRYPFYNISSRDHRYHNKTITPWTWAMFG